VIAITTKCRKGAERSTNLTGIVIVAHPLQNSGSKCALAKTLIFVASSGREEKVWWGSRAMASAIPAELAWLLLND